ncbi:hypothetical protein SUGI_1099660 [Cryptomeria japonica]|nr:hypothetical protein SUGI_1099660 [Cryptomeria japonica]
MPSIPAIGEVTICEINRELFTAKDDSDSQPTDAYGKILGLVFHPIHFQVEEGFSCVSGAHFDQEPDRKIADVIPSVSEDTDSVQEGGILSRKFAVVKNILAYSFGPIFHPYVVKRLNKFELFQGVSWHKHKHILAFISGPNQVTVHDFEDSDWQGSSILTSDSQRGVEAIEWRPNSGTTLSVACRGGICIWTASFPGSVAPARSGVVSFLGTTSRGTGLRWTLTDFLKSPGSETVTTLSWTSASLEDSSITIWDVAQGVGTPLRRGLGGVSLLKWSPTGDYLFSAKPNGTFYLWETNTWTSEPWSSSGGSVISATWGPDGRMLFMAFSESITLGSLHFSGRPPSLDAHLLPVDLPEIGSITGGVGNIEKMAWDGSGERLAVSYCGGDLMYAGLIAIYDTRRTPFISASLIGFIRGPGEQVKPLALAFHDKFKQGPLLSVCWSSGVCCTYPFIFRSN